MVKLSYHTEVSEEVDDILEQIPLWGWFHFFPLVLTFGLWWLMKWLQITITEEASLFDVYFDKKREKKRHRGLGLLTWGYTQIWKVLEITLICCQDMFQDIAFCALNSFSFFFFLSAQCHVTALYRNYSKNKIEIESSLKERHWVKKVSFALD